MRDAQLHNSPGRSRGALWAVLLVLAVASVGWGGHHRTRARCLPALPCQPGYQVGRSTPPVTAVSTAVVVLRREVAATAASAVTAASGTTPAPSVNRGAEKQDPQTGVSFFQLDKPALVLDHCSISRVAVMLQSDGSWRVSLRADQNPGSTVGVAAAGSATTVPVAVTPALPVPPAQKQTSHLKRNEFHVAVRGYGADKASESADLKAPGKPLLFHIDLQPFWVQNGVPRNMVWDGTSRNNDGTSASNDIKRFFSLVDRVEIDLSYR